MFHNFTPSVLYDLILRFRKKWRLFYRGQFDVPGEERSHKNECANASRLFDFTSSVMKTEKKCEC